MIEILVQENKAKAVLCLKSNNQPARKLLTMHNDKAALMLMGVGVSLSLFPSHCPSLIAPGPVSSKMQKILQHMSISSNKSRPPCPLAGGWGEGIQLMGVLHIKTITAQGTLALSPAEKDSVFLKVWTWFQ